MFQLSQLSRKINNNKLISYKVLKLSIDTYFVVLTLQSFEYKWILMNLKCWMCWQGDSVIYTYHCSVVRYLARDTHLKWILWKHSMHSTHRITCQTHRRCFRSGLRGNLENNMYSDLKKCTGRCNSSWDTDNDDWWWALAQRLDTGVTLPGISLELHIFCTV